MNGRIPTSVLRAAAKQARVAMTRKYSSPQGLGAIGIAAFLVAIIWFFRDADFMDAVGAAAYLFAGFLALTVISGAMLTIASEIQLERESGTLLRAKAIPHGITGHLLAKLMSVPVELAIAVVPMLIGIALITPEALPSGAGRWVVLVATMLLGTASMLPWGAVLGSIFRTMIGMSVAMLVIYGVTAVSGFFFPVTMLPGWAQSLVQLTPIYWVGLGLRGAMLPESAAAVEIGGVWRSELTVLVLVGWAVLGLVLATVFLRRMARRQSGSTVAAARERVMARGY
ncbi:ABC transporter permease [Ornithinimicrobium pratense]|uniref:ABC transporter permease n=1 Tax=Ornithinimicrobium pratense TaxID=2593973 RepID=A0A5J6V114_9MICO|nr:ABC transporter permease [Ornithinimicrobium pratense]QFG67330.1 ABC transporter permease [Ornithinimicrobium pratense]